ncbi:MAG TPA: hypothetical protein VFY68_16185 [Nitrososphaeraceae archaeon]|nr:hypothetical protein [Nitrososphaeraceae archaeon]
MLYNRGILCLQPKLKLRHLGEFIDTDGKIKFQPNEVILKDDISAVLKDSNGSKITKWDR